MSGSDITYDQLVQDITHAVNESSSSLLFQLLNDLLDRNEKIKEVKTKVFGFLSGLCRCCTENRQKVDEVLEQGRDHTLHLLLNTRFIFSGEDGIAKLEEAIAFLLTKGADPLKDVRSVHSAVEDLLLYAKEDPEYLAHVLSRLTALHKMGVETGYFTLASVDKDPSDGGKTFEQHLLDSPVPEIQNLVSTFKVREAAQTADTAPAMPQASAIAPAVLPTQMSSAELTREQAIQQKAKVILEQRAAERAAAMP